MEFVKQIGTLFRTGTAAGVTDTQLLEQYLERRGHEAEDAFATLVDRHGAMVLRVCRQILPSEEDAEDAAQATFLVLARRAPSISRRESLACWLHGVARRVAANLRVAHTRRRKLEHREGELRAAGHVIHADFDAIENHDDWVRLHDELGSLPRSFREPLILCYLDGLTQEQAAAQLRCPLGTIQSRLARGRAKLKTQLEKRSVGLPSAFTPANQSGGLPSFSAPQAWTEATVRMALEFAHAKTPAIGGTASVALAERICRTIVLSHWKVGATMTFLTAVFLSGATALALLPRTESRQAPHFDGTSIPDPPRQSEPWQPPTTSLPTFLSSASATLFGQGLADPRGCDYHAIEIGIGNVWNGGGGVIKTRGWVLPAPAGAKTRFAVAWSGLVYPVASIGEPADPADDVKVIDRIARASRAAGDNMDDPGFDGFGTNNEESAVSPTSLLAIKVCLLLRLGRADLAETVWAAGSRPRDARFGAANPKAKLDENKYNVSYVTLANDLAWNLFDRAVCAHMRGDDALALADARKLTTLQKDVETRAKAMGFNYPRRPGDGAEGSAPYIQFLSQLPDLLADHERRAREPKRPPVPPPGADPKKRIAALIADLDQVAARQFGQPGGVSLGDSPVVEALVEARDAAVEPLLDDFETDIRLTRSVHFHRDFNRSRTIMGAHEAAYTALSGILKTSFFDAVSTGDNLSARGLEGRKVVANRIRAYWEKNRDVPLVERWYRTLADDVAAPREWLQAAGSIIQHENVSVVPGSTAFNQAVTTPLPPGARPRLRGEALRAKLDPSVAELMAMRAKEIDPGGPLAPNSHDQFNVTSANQMASMLAEWDIKAALPVLKARMERSARLAQAEQETGPRIFGLKGEIASLTRLRTKAGDTQALDDFAGWIRTVTPGQLDSQSIGMFEPLWSNPDHPAMIAAAAALFEDPKSSWNPSLSSKNFETHIGVWQDLLSGSLLGLKSFRTLVLRALADKTQVGTVEADAAGTVTVIQGENKTVEDGNSTSVSVVSSGELSPRTDSPVKPGPGAMPLRVADLVCEDLQELPGIPRFQKQWPLAKRDQVIGACIAYLKQFGERFRENAASRAIRAAEPGGPRHERAILAFDPLDHPATADDVAAGRAIFSLERAGAEVRRFPLPAFPLDARWTKLEVFPNDPPRVSVYDNEGNEVPNTEALQGGRVWQAEEVRVGDQWHRYFGFAGRHALTRVDAEEIELTTPWQQGWWLLSTDLDARIVINEAATGDPVPVEVSFRNHRGLDATAPAELVRAAGGAQSIRDGIAFRLVRISDNPNEPKPFTELEGAREKPFPPEEIPARPFRRHPAGASPRTLPPAGTISAFQLALRTVFPIERPGRYRLEITFDDLKTSKGMPGKVATIFSVVARKTD